jgi:hypothetical protein
VAVEIPTPHKVFLLNRNPLLSMSKNNVSDSAKLLIEESNKSAVTIILSTYTLNSVKVGEAVLPASPQ